MSFRFRITDEARADLAGLDNASAQRVLRRIRWLSEHAEQVRREALGGDLAGYFKLRAGDYRVLYVVDDEAQEIIVRGVGHRSSVYRDRS
ncbi:MAG TPA: type II toxin-antitoxin system RelE/ParE family toxin [Tepidiformaceae bacterium]|nr:type II toxin-antitoxin system RelE/ParE family toxin [Tepidiformaceae bacterium]